MTSPLANSSILHWLISKGMYALFPALALGILGLPIPDETLITLAGGMMANGKWPIETTIPIVLLGAMCGITLSYVLGRTAGHFLLMKYGRWIGLNEAKIRRTHQWFERFGKWLLIIGYFIPGVRHLTGYVAGTLELKYRDFALFAYTGATIWASTFLSLGYFFGGLYLRYPAT